MVLPMQNPVSLVEANVYAILLGGLAEATPPFSISVDLLPLDRTADIISDLLRFETVSATPYTNFILT